MKYFKDNLSKEEIEDIVSLIDNEGFWYAITQFPKFIFKHFKDEKTKQKIQEAIKVLEDFEKEINNLEFLI